MKKIELVVKKELFDNIDVTISQLHWRIDKKNDFLLCGSVSSKGEKLEGYLLEIRANLCDEEGGILFIDRCYSEISFELINYDTFSTSCSDLSRFIDMDKLHHIEVYPHVKKVE